MNTRQSDMVPTTILMMSDTTVYYYCTINLTVIHTSHDLIGKMDIHEGTEITFN